MITIALLLNAAILAKSYFFAEWMSDMEAVDSHSSTSLWYSCTLLIHERRIKSNPSSSFFRYYLFLCMVCLMVTVLHAMCEVALTMKGCEQLHQRLVERVMLAKMSWFDSTPVGRIVNRFSQDVSIVDKYVLEAMMNFVGLLLRTGKFPCL